MSESIPSPVLAAYGFRDAVAQKRLGGTRNANFHVRGDHCSIFLRRRHADYCAREWIGFDHDAVRFLQSRGARVQSPIETGDGETWLYHDGECWEAYPWVDGDPYPATAEALDSVANQLAAFHLAGKDFRGKYLPGGFPRGETTPDRLLGIARQLGPSCGNISSFYAAQVREAGNRLDDLTYGSLQQILVHGDIQPGNMIFSGSELITFVDYDWLGRQPAIYDLAGALILLCGIRSKPINSADIWSLTMPFEFDLNSTRRFLATYSSGIELNREMAPLLLEQVRLTWSHMRLSGALKVPEEDRREFLIRDHERPYAWIDRHRDETFV